MTEQEIFQKIQILINYQSETNQIEAKTAKDGCPKKYYDTISSFANTCGGTILFGIDEENGFKEQKIYDINDLQSKISALCKDCMEPIIRPEFLMVDYNGQKILAVNIYEIPQNQKPCYYKPLGISKGSYIRVGDNDEHMTEYEIYSLQSIKMGYRKTYALLKEQR